jgi:hypothetical protein
MQWPIHYLRFHKFNNPDLMAYWFLEPVREQQTRTVSIKYKYFCSTKLQNFVDDSLWKEEEEKMLY